MSVTIIARDEADRIGAAIQSVAFADEVVVLDCGSTDDTVAVAEGLGARVIRTDWPGFVAAGEEVRCVGAVLAAVDAVTRDDIQEVLHRFPFSAHSTIAVGPLAELSAAK